MKISRYHNALFDGLAVTRALSFPILMEAW
jgi:hypothetical protein